MSEITDLQAKFDDMAATVQKSFADASAKLDALIAAGSGDSPELAAFKADVSSVSDSLKSAAQALDTKATS